MLMFWNVWEMCLICGEVVHYIYRMMIIKGEGVEMWKAIVNFKIAWIMDKGKQSLSVAIAAPLRQCVPASGGHDWDKLSLPPCKTQDSEWRSRWGCGEDIRAVEYKVQTWGASPCGKVHRDVGYEQCEHFHRHMRRNSSWYPVQPFQLCVARLVFFRDMTNY